MEIGNANPVIVEKLLASSPGQLLPPFELDGWWLIIRLEKLLPASLNEMMRTRLINEMYELSIMSKIKKTLLDLSKDQVNLEVIQIQ